MQKVKTFFNELAVVGRSVSLKDFNLYVFHSLYGEFKDLVTNLVTKAKLFLYANLHSHLLTHEFLHKTSLQSMMVTPPLLLTPAQPSSSNVAHNQSSSSYNNSPNFSHGKPR